MPHETIADILAQYADPREAFRFMPHEAPAKWPLAEGWRSSLRGPVGLDSLEAAGSNPLLQQGVLEQMARRSRNYSAEPPSLLAQFLSTALPMAEMALPGRAARARLPPPLPIPVRRGRMNYETGQWHGAEPIKPEFGSKEWARNTALAIEYSPIWQHIGPAAVGSYLASKLYDPLVNNLESGVKSVKDWVTDPNGHVVTTIINGQMRRHPPLGREPTYPPPLPYFPQPELSLLPPPAAPPDHD